MRTRKRERFSSPQTNTQVKSVKKYCKRQRFLVGNTLEKMERNQLSLRKHIIQHYLYLRDINPRKPLKELVSCPLQNKTFRFVLYYFTCVSIPSFFCQMDIECELEFQCKTKFKIPPFHKKLLEHICSLYHAVGKRYFNKFFLDYPALKMVPTVSLDVSSPESWFHEEKQDYQF